MPWSALIGVPCCNVWLPRVPSIVRVEVVPRIVEHPSTRIVHTRRPLVLFPGTPLLVISRTMIARHDRSHELVYLGGQTSHRASCHGPCNSWPRCFPDSLGHCTLDLAYQVVVEFVSSLRSTIRFSQYEGQAVVALAAFVSLNSILDCL